MAFEPTLEEQQLLAETVERPVARMSRREALVEASVGLALAAAVAGLWLIQPPASFAIAPAAVCIVLLAVAMRLRFDTPLGFTVPTQLAFVPLLFATPVAIVPVAVVVAVILADLPDFLRGRLRASRLCTGLGNAWFAIGPAAVFALSHTAPRDAGIALLVAALGAQFAVDFAISALRYAADRGTRFALQPGDLWVYGIDAALSPAGLLAAGGIHGREAAALALLPFLGVLAMFAHERGGRLRSLLEKLNHAYHGTALLLGDFVEADDGYTGEHSKGVVNLALEVAERLDLDAERRRNLEFAALLHDVGKIAIPKTIINKPGKLDPAEWTIIKTHTVEGQKMLERVGGFMREVGLIVRSHHERWDGSGYPDGLAGEAIPLEARIIACCDTWNAMRTDRPYRKALPVETALRELLASAGSQLDPHLAGVVAAFIESERAAPAPAPEASAQRETRDSSRMISPAADPSPLVAA